MVSVTETEPPGAPGPGLRRDDILFLCRPGVLNAVVQPIVRPSDMEVVGYEALARMPIEPRRPPDWWLEAAEAHQLRHELELACFRAAAALGTPPDGRVLFVNVSPSTLADPTALEVRETLPVRLVIELTEQEAVEDYDGLRHRLGAWLGRGVRVAVDDTGAGFSSLRHVVELAPDYLKLDRELVRGVDTDPTRRALLRAVVAFAREVGTSVIAEGVETHGELAVLRDAHVHLVQGYLLARPAPMWPDIRRPAPPIVSGIPGEGDGVMGRYGRSRYERLRGALEGTDNVVEACEIVVEDLFREDHLLSSLYLVRDRELRCVAQRGLWQVLDGLPGSAGITGRTWETGRAIVVEEVAEAAEYLEAIPGVVSEICVPVVVDGESVGALNVESQNRLPQGTLGVMETVAGLLGERLGVIGTSLGNTRWQRAAPASAAISGLTPGRRLPQQVLHRLLQAAAMDSACLVTDDGEGPRPVSAVGPLAGSLLELTTGELVSLTRLVSKIRSSYTAGDATGLGFVGTESLRVAGARAVVILPLWAQRRRFGTLVLAHSRPLSLSGDWVEPLELLSDTVAAVLAPPWAVDGAPARPPLGRP